MRRHGYDGINIDFENGPATDRDALTAFVSELAAQLHAIGKDLSVEVSAKFQHTTTGRSGLYDYEALGAAADHVFVMNWGWHWSTSAPGAPDDMEMCRRVADYVASMPNKERFVLATHMYGMDWPAGGGPAHTAAALEYADVQALIAAAWRNAGARTRVGRLDLQLHGRRGRSTRGVVSRTPPRLPGG